MKKFQELSLISQAILVYLLSIVVSIVLTPLFSKFYLWAYKPNLILSGFFTVGEPKLEIYLGAFCVGYLLFLSFLTFLFVKDKRWLILFIGAIIILLTSLDNNVRYIFWDLVLLLTGWLLAKLILLIKAQAKK